ncbi:MAG: ABC transporter permease, partial [Nitrospirota bacterium]
MSYSTFIALRYLKGKHKRAPISLNTIISIGGVALGVMTLIIVLSVMSGFENDLETKILGTNSPIIITSFNDKGIPDYARQMKKIQAVPHVVSVAPFTYSEVMLTSPGGVSGIILKGVDPASIGKVTKLSKAMVAGKISGLSEAGPAPGILLGRELAVNLDVQIGDK